MRQLGSPRPVFWMQIALLLGLIGIASYSSARQLVSSIYPLHLISQAVTAGIETPSLLMSAGQDGHHLQMSPGQARSLRRADLVIWVGPALEAPLKPMLAGQRHQLALQQVHGLRVLPLRDLSGHPLRGSVDPHLWLDPINAIGIAHAIAAYRSVQYPADAPRYQANARQFSQQMLSALTAARANPNRGYWAWHDAYQYLERSQRLTFLGALTTDPELAPSLSRLQQTAQLGKPTCLLSGSTPPATLLRRLPALQPILLEDTLASSRQYVSAWQDFAVRLKSCP